MSYPYGPQGFQQPAYGPQPGWYPPQPAPSGATAITAGCLGLALAALSLIGGIVSFTALNEAERTYNEVTNSSAGPRVPGVDLEFVKFLAFIQMPLGIAWATGSLLLLLRKPSGRVILIVLAGIAGILNLIGMVQARMAGLPITSGIGLALALTILALCLTPATALWLSTAPNRLPRNAFPPGYYPTPPANPYGPQYPPRY